MSDYGIITPEMITKKANVKEGDILIIYTGYSKYSWEKPDSSEFGFYVRHPGPNMEFFEWAMKMKFKWVGIDAGCIEHPMNTPIKYWHERDFAKAKDKLRKDYGKEWDEMFPPEVYYQIMHLKLFPRRLVHAENLGGDIDKLSNKRVYMGAFNVKGIEMESTWTRIVAWTP